MSFHLEGTDASKLKITGWKSYDPSNAIVTYPTNIREPYTLRFNILVKSVGNRYGRFPSTILIQGCDNEANTITNPNEAAWKTKTINESPNRSWTNIAIREFTYSNAYCKRLKYSVHGKDVAYMSVSGTTLRYRSNIQEPKTLEFTLRVHAQGDGINGKSHIKDYPSTLKI